MESRIVHPFATSSAREFRNGLRQRTTLRTQSSEWAQPVYLEYCEGRLSVFRRIFAGDLVDLLPSQLLWGDPGRIAGVAEETVQAGRRHDPEQE
jgi:hypothetical protein